MSSLQGHEEVVELLQANGAKVDQATNDGTTPLSTRSQEGR